MKTKTDNVQSIADVHQRKLELRRKMVAQKEEILALASDLQDDITPSNLIKLAKNELFKTFETEKPVVNRLLAQNIATVSSYFIRNNKKAFLVKWLGPVALAAAPKIWDWAKEKLPSLEEVKLKMSSAIGHVKNVFQ